MESKNSAWFFLVILVLASNTRTSNCSPPYYDYPTPSTPTPPYAPPSPSGGYGGGGGGSNNCPSILNLNVCASLLGGLLGLTVGVPSAQPCCSVIQGLLNLEAAACLCAALQANILGVNLNVPLSANLLLSTCGYQDRPGFQCS